MSGNNSGNQPAKSVQTQINNSNNTERNMGLADAAPNSNNRALGSSNEKVNELMPHKHLQRQNDNLNLSGMNMEVAGSENSNTSVSSEGNDMNSSMTDNNMNSDMNNSDTNAGMRNSRGKRNYPNPAWPSMQPVVVMPPGSNTTSLGLPDASVYRNRLSVDTGDYGINPMNNIRGNRNSQNNMNAGYDKEYKNMNRILNNMNSANNMNSEEYRRNGNLMNSAMNDYLSMGTEGMERNVMRGGTGSMNNNINIMPPVRNRYTPNYKISDMVRIRPSYMEDMTMTEYMMGRIGEYIKVDLCCGGIGSSKVGVLREIGDDFIVLEDVETGNYMVCSLKSIQLIYVYDDGDNE